jgi:hypothetical protein
MTSDVLIKRIYTETKKYSEPVSVNLTVASGQENIWGRGLKNTQLNTRICK